ncbi:MAG: mechanosensitive ion channel family protein [Bacilli bacterium]|jgi:small-conductance mechanosensitive channel
MEKIIKVLPISNLIIFLLVILSFYLFFKIMNKIIKSTLKIRAHRIGLSERKRRTLELLFQKITKYILIGIVILIIFSLFGIDKATLIASVSVFGVVIGLAFQDTLKDILAGIFVLLEDRYSEGDYIKVDDFMGEVVYLGLKITKIRNFLGETKIIANRHIEEVINYSISDSTAVIDIDVAYDSNMEKVEEVLQTTIKELNLTVKHLRGEFNLLGIQNIGYFITYRITVKTEPMQQYGVKRIALKEIKKALDKNKIKRIR